MVRYHGRSPSERLYEEHRQLVNRQEQGCNGQEEQGLSPEDAEVYGRTQRGCYRYRRRSCSRRRLNRIHSRRRPSCGRRRKRCCRSRRRPRRDPGGGEDAEGTKLPGPLTPCWKLRKSHLPRNTK
nr:protamine-2 isoform X2 [Aotus nancymaae]